MKAVLAMLAPALVASCADIQAALRAQDPASAGPGERHATPAELGLQPGGLLALDRGLQLALDHNPQVAAARTRVRSAEARILGAAAAQLPQVSVSASGRAAVDDVDHKLDKSQSGSLAISQLLLDFGRSSAAIRQAGEEWHAAQSDLAAAENDLAFNFRQTYYNALKQEQLIRVAQETVRQFEKRLEQVQGFVEVGTRARFDLTKAQVDLGNAQLHLVRARTQLAVARAALNSLLGLVDDPGFILAKPAFETPADPLPAVEALYAQARARHPRLRSFRHLERGAIAGIDAAIADLLPQISLSASFSYAGALTPVGWTLAGGPALHWLVFGGWSRTARLDESVQGLRQVRSNLAAAEQQVVVDIRQAAANLQDAIERFRISELTVKQAQENLELSQGRFEVGRASSVELTDAQVLLANARAELVQAEFDIQIALAALRRAVGGPE
jgi:outer membrane protein